MVDSELASRSMKPWKSSSHDSKRHQIDKKNLAETGRMTRRNVD